MKSVLIVIMVSILSFGFLAVPVNSVFAQTAPDPWQTVQPDPNSWQTSDGTPCDPEQDIMLNTYIPFIGRCIKRSVNAWSSETTVVNVFPNMVGWLTRILMTAIVIMWFLGILTGWFMIASDWAFGTKQMGVKLIVSIIAWLILLWASGIILNLINPNFFWTAS